MFLLKVAHFWDKSTFPPEQEEQLFPVLDLLIAGYNFCVDSWLMATRWKLKRYFYLVPGWAIKNHHWTISKRILPSMRFGMLPSLEKIMSVILKNKYIFVHNASFYPGASFFSGSRFSSPIFKVWYNLKWNKFINDKDLLYASLIRNSNK